MSRLRRDANERPLIGDVLRHFSETPESTFWPKWFGGVIVPVLSAIYAMRCCISRKGLFIGKGVVRVTGKTAVILGLCWLSAAAFLHFHYFWTTSKRLYVFADTGKIIAVLLWIVTFVYVCWLIFTR